MIHMIAILYGVLLVTVAFVRTPFTEAMRVDTLFTQKNDDATRPINLVFGLLVAGYGLWSLIK